MTGFQEKLAYLDAALTRKPLKDVVHTARTQGFTPERFLNREQYHLSDGGYSRIGCDDDGRLFLDSVSLAGPKAGWRYCKELIQDVQDLVDSELRSYTT